MGRVDHYPGGTFCWAELVSPDVRAATRLFTIGDLLIAAAHPPQRREPVRA